MQKKTMCLQEVARQTRLEFNIKKIKCLRVKSLQGAPIQLSGQDTKDVDSFTYLGSTVSKTGGTKQNIQARIGEDHHAFVTLNPV